MVAPIVVVGVVAGSAVVLGTLAGDNPFEQASDANKLYEETMEKKQSKVFTHIGDFFFGQTEKDKAKRRFAKNIPIYIGRGATATYKGIRWTHRQDQRLTVKFWNALKPPAKGSSRRGRQQVLNAAKKNGNFQEQYLYRRLKQKGYIA